MDSLPTLVNTLVNSFIVKPTSTENYIGSKGFVFDILGDEDAMLDSDITDHYVEENYSIQDHIALRPAKFTLSGYIGEMSDIVSNSFLNILTSIQSLSSIGDYTLPFGAQATQVYNKIAGVTSQAGMVLNQASNAFQFFTGMSTANSKQQSAYNFFQQLWFNRSLCMVETPWAVWPDMAIENIRILQRDQNKFVSEFSVTFKQIRKVSVKNSKDILQKYSLNNNVQMPSLIQDGRVSDMLSPPSLSGTVTGQGSFADNTTVDVSALNKDFSGLGKMGSI